MRQVFQFLSTITLVSMCFFSAASYADSGLYIGGSIGSTSLGIDTPDDSELDFSDDDNGYKLFAGLRFTILAVEAGYVDFGGINVGEGESSASADISGFNAFGVLILGVGPVDLFAKAGGFVWEADGELAEEKYKEDGFDPAVGVGGSLTFGSLSVRAEYEYYDVSDFDELSMVSLGLTYTFL